MTSAEGRARPSGRAATVAHAPLVRWTCAAAVLLLVRSFPITLADTVGEVAAFTAASANVADPGKPVSIHILRWSTDEERAPIVAALNPPPRTAAPAPAAASAGDAAARGRGAAGRGGRGRGRGRGEATAPLTPIAALTAAIGRAPTVGYIWTGDVTGYSIKYAFRAAMPDGGARIVLATDRRLGADTPTLRPASGPLTDYEFTVLEIRVDAAGAGEAKSSLTAKVIVDREANTLAVEEYAAAVAILKNIRHAPSGRT